ncbi:hypothetical protein DENSPDRAFT_113997 [Dentipellis sp. KUC8613]|nr:hypothetical protein DENSPDRAFT_113997 [Dentipellis sp. KUC8613]
MSTGSMVAPVTGCCSSHSLRQPGLFLFLRVRACVCSRSPIIPSPDRHRTGEAAHDTPPASSSCVCACACACTPIRIQDARRLVFVDALALARASARAALAPVFRPLASAAEAAGDYDLLLLSPSSINCVPNRKSSAPVRICRSDYVRVRFGCSARKWVCAGTSSELLKVVLCLVRLWWWGVVRGGSELELRRPLRMALGFRRTYGLRGIQHTVYGIQ